LFQLEVSEINDGTIEVKGIAREPGYRTKLAVYSRALAFESPCLGTGLGKVAWALVGHPETSGCSA
jgi:hypothetical protein